MKFGAHVYYTKTYSTNQQQVCKQQQTASGNKNLLFMFVAITRLYYDPHVYYTKTYTTNQQQVCKQQQTASGKKHMLVPITSSCYVV